MDRRFTPLAIIDGDFIPFFVCHVKRGEPIKSLEDCKGLCDSFIASIVAKTKSEYYTGFLTKGKCFRYDIYDKYKANRKYLGQPDYLFEVREYLRSDYGFISIEGYEADDLCISLRRQLSEGYECIVVSTDKDLLNTEGVNYNPREGKFIRVTESEARYLFWTQMLTGDSADNIKGCKGVGEVGAVKVLEAVDLIHGNYRSTVLDKYCEVYGEHVGIDEFWRNYKCLKIVDNITVEGFTLNNAINLESSEQKE